MRVLVTRSLPDAPATAHDLALHGIETVLTPLFDAGYLTPEIPEKNYQAAVFTSRHAARQFRAHYKALSIPAFCVGNQTASLLYGSNFSDIHSADGDRVALYRMIHTMLQDRRRPLLRLHGELEHDPLTDDLLADGFDVTCVGLYHMIPNAERDQAVIDTLRTTSFDGICFYSPRTAAHFAALMKKEGLAEACRPLTAWCISNNTRAVLDQIPFRKVLIAAHPTHRHMMTLIADTTPE